MIRAWRFGVLSMTVLGLVLATRDAATAGPLDPSAFATQGMFPTAPGDYTIWLGPGSAELSGPGGMFVAVTYQDSPGHFVSVFDFDSINLTKSVNISTSSAPGSYPVVFLSRGDAIISGTLDVSAGGQAMNVSALNGPGGYAGGYYPDNGPGGGLSGPSGDLHGTILGVSGGGGGGFGGPGSSGSAVTVPPSPPEIPFPTVIPGGAGGHAYGDITQQLVGGSGGSVNPDAVGTAGGGGGAVEIGAAGHLTVDGKIVADGGIGEGVSGGGSGGAIFLHAASVDITGSLEALGGSGGPGNTSGEPPMGAGGSGGGGQIAILYSSSYSNLGTVDVGNGIFTASAVPEPSSLILLGTGLLGALGLGLATRTHKANASL